MPQRPPRLGIDTSGRIIHERPFGLVYGAGGQREALRFSAPFAEGQGQIGGLQANPKLVLIHKHMLGMGAEGEQTSVVT